MYDQYQLQFIGFKMSHKTNSSLDDTIPLDKNAPGFGLSDSNQHIMDLNSQCPPVTNPKIHQSRLYMRSSIWKVPSQMREKTK